MKHHYHPRTILTRHRIILLVQLNLWLIGRFLIYVHSRLKAFVLTLYHMTLQLFAACEAIVARAWKYSKSGIAADA